jgi:inosine-uridine nucleoside N-ribohydrolase
VTGLVVDSDNGLGSPRGDVDDGLALIALFRSGLPIAALASVFGNTAEWRARANHRTLAALCGYQGSILAGAAAPLRGPAPLSEASRFLVTGSGPWRVVALGPLTNLAAALEARPEVARRITEVVAVGANRTSRGRWPPFWPHEFNLTADRRATRVVMESGVPLTLVPLDVARRLVVTPADLAALPGTLGEHVRRHAARWFRRAVFVRGRRAFPVWDLVAALFVVDPAACGTESTVARLHPTGWLELGAGTRPVTLVRAFDPRALWRRFVALATAEPRSASQPA